MSSSVGLLHAISDSHHEHPRLESTVSDEQPECLAGFRVPEMVSLANDQQYVVDTSMTSQSCTSAGKLRMPTIWKLPDSTAVNSFVAYAKFHATLLAPCGSCFGSQLCWLALP